MIELPKLKNTGRPEFDMLYNLFIETPRAVRNVETVIGVGLIKYKEVIHMFDFETEVRRREVKGVAMGRKEGIEEGRRTIALSMLQRRKLELEEIVYERERS